MSIVALLITLAVILLMLWLVNLYMPMPWKTPLLAVIVLMAVIWLALLLFPGITGMRVGR